MHKHLFLLSFLLIVSSPYSNTASAAADIDYSKEEHPQMNALYDAVGDGKYDTVAQLLADGFPINGYSRDYHPLHYAVTMVSESADQDTALQILTLLFDNGADPNLTWTGEMDDSIETPLLAAAQCRSDLITPAVKLLLERGAAIDFQNNEGTSALHRATRWGSNACVRTLIERGANTFLKNKNGQTALDIASEPGWASQKTKKMLEAAQMRHEKALLDLKTKRAGRLFCKMHKKKSQPQLSLSTHRSDLCDAPWPTWDQAHNSN